MTWHHLRKTDFQSRVMIFLSKHATFLNSDQFALAILRDHIHYFNLLSYICHMTSDLDHIRETHPHLPSSPHIFCGVHRRWARLAASVWGRVVASNRMPYPPAPGYEKVGDDCNLRSTFDKTAPMRHTPCFRHRKSLNSFSVMMNPPSPKKNIQVTNFVTWPPPNMDHVPIPWAFLVAPARRRNTLSLQMSWGLVPTLGIVDSLECWEN